MKSYTVKTGEREMTVVVNDDGRTTLDGKAVELTVSPCEPGVYAVVADGRSHRFPVRQDDEGYLLLSRGMPLSLIVESERDRMVRAWAGATTAALHRAEIHAPMPALVVRLEVSEGDAVTPGQGVVILEAMKMENEIKTLRGGVVKSIHVQKGQAVDKGQLLIVIE